MAGEADSFVSLDLLSLLKRFYFQTALWSFSTPWEGSSFRFQVPQAIDRWERKIQIQKNLSEEEQVELTKVEIP